jgi:hypothetical protein
LGSPDSTVFGDRQYFDVAAGTAAVTLEDTGLGTASGSSLTVNGLAVNVTSTLTAPLYVDSNPLTASPVHLLPGRHSYSTVFGEPQYFDVAAGTGAVTLEDTGLGTASGSSLTINGLAVTIDATALGVAALYVDWASHIATSPFSVQLLPGRHEFNTGSGTDITWFDVGENGIRMENPLFGSGNGNRLTITGLA